MREYSQTTYHSENQVFCFELFTAAHFFGFHPNTWFPKDSQPSEDISRRFLRAEKLSEGITRRLFLMNIKGLVGFGRACAPVFLGLLTCQTGAARPSPRPSQLPCFLFDPQKYIKSVELGPPTSRAYFFPQDHRGYEI